jgi:DNA replication protein DnaC
MNDALRSALKQLRLSGLLESLEVRLQEAAGHGLSHVEFLELILQDELAVRGDRQLRRRLVAAQFRELKTLEDFDWSFNPSIKRKQIYDLASGRFIRETRDVLFLGPPGVGKSFLVQDKVLAHYLKPDLLLIDDMGMKQLPKRSGEYLFEIIMRRYETRSTVMTSNRPLEDWGKLLGDVPSATAILDRFLHHAEIVQITGKSYRLRNAARPDKEGLEESTPAPTPTSSDGRRSRAKPAKAPTGSEEESAGSKPAKAPTGSEEVPPPEN